MKAMIQPWLARAISSDFLLSAKRKFSEASRKRKGEPHVVSVFIKVDDPYSYLLLQAICEFRQRYELELNYYLVSNMQQGMFPEPDLWKDNAFKDAAAIATLYKFDYPELCPNYSSESVLNLACQLQCITTEEDFSERACVLLKQFWAGTFVADNSLDDCTDVLKKNDRLLESMGHYLGAMVHYAGEWYWGVDRLGHLEARLNSSDTRKSELYVVYDQSIRHFCKRLTLDQSVRKRPTTPLTLFFSARSPYSYLGLERAVTLSKHYGVPIEIKPVLPMMMRGMNVPETKKWYIFLDTKREAKRMGIEYGFVADPLGKAVERCYALFEYAKAEGKEVDYLLSFARAVNAQGIRADTDAGLKLIVERCGLSWAKAKTNLHQDSWREWADDNYSQMHALGLWGVPSLQYGDLAVWGQDRIDTIEQAICESIITLNASEK